MTPARALASLSVVLVCGCSNNDAGDTGNGKGGLSDTGGSAGGLGGANVGGAPKGGSGGKGGASTAGAGGTSAGKSGSSGGKGGASGASSGVGGSSGSAGTNGGAGGGQAGSGGTGGISAGAAGAVASTGGAGSAGASGAGGASGVAGKASAGSAGQAGAGASGASAGQGGAGGGGGMAGAAAAGIGGAAGATGGGGAAAGGGGSGGAAGTGVCSQPCPGPDYVAVATSPLTHTGLWWEGVPLQCYATFDPDQGCGSATPCGDWTTTQWTCSNGQCAVAACQPGRADCDGLPSNGCETSLDDPAHCASCASQCQAGEQCTPTGCAPACAPPSTLCSGSCTSLSTSTSHCGGCGLSCATKPGQAVSCVGGMCQYACPPDHTMCNGVCVAGTDCSHSCCANTDIPVGGYAVCEKGVCVRDCGPNAVPFDLGGAWICHDNAACPGGACTPPGTSPLAATTLSSFPDFVVGQTYVFWVEGNDIVRVPKAGGTTDKLVVALPQPRGLAVRGGYVYWANGLGGALARAPESGGPPETLGAANSPDMVMADDTHAYWVDRGTNRILRVAVDNSGATEVVDSDLAIQNLHRSTQLGSSSGNLAMDDAYVYYSVNVPSTDCAQRHLVRVSKDGSARTPLCTDFGNPQYVFVSSDRLFVLRRYVGVLSSFLEEHSKLDGSLVPGGFFLPFGEHSIGSVALDGDTPWVTSFARALRTYDCGAYATVFIDNAVTLELDATGFYWTDNHTLFRSPR